MSSPDTTYKLTYFNIHGAAEKVRLAFILYGIPFEDERINFGDWAALKPTTKFGQLPLLSINGGEPIAQSGAMLRYVGRLGDGSLYPSDSTNLLQIEEVLGLAGDFDRSYAPCIYITMSPELYGYPSGSQQTQEGKDRTEQIRRRFVESSLPEYISFYSALLEKNGNQFLCGANPTIADCYVLPQLRRLQSGQVDHILATCLDGYPIITAWIERMLALPAIDQWYNGPK